MSAGSHFVHPNGFVKLDRLDQAPTVIHVTLTRSQYLVPELGEYLEAKLGSPVYLSVYFGTAQPEVDIYALVPPEDVLRVLGASERVLRAEVRRRKA